jgi:hypothetical protein
MSFDPTERGSNNSHGAPYRRTSKMTLIWYLQIRLMINTVLSSIAVLFADLGADDRLFLEHIPEIRGGILRAHDTLAILSD